jgi:hypothetical protein
MRENGKGIDSFRKLLTPETQRTYYSNVDLWEKGNKIKDGRLSGRKQNA